ncbi:MAG TPA: DUF1707 domain-containing protein [Trebonia sp.]|jgi:hypothetical protein
MAAAVRRPRMLASMADRDRTIRILQASFVEGRLATDEFKQRVGLAIVARDFRELLALTADLPAGPLDRLPAHRVTPRPPARRQPRWWFTRLARGLLGRNNAACGIWTSARPRGFPR